MKKEERFVVFGKIKNGIVIEEVALTSFTTYPSDEVLQEVWEDESEHKKIYFIRVEKQIRFVEED